MEQTHFPEQAIVADDAVYLIVPGLKKTLEPVLQRLQSDKPVEAETKWYFGRSKATDTVVVLQVNWDTGQRSNIGFAEQHWNLLPSIAERDVVGLTYSISPEGEVPGIVPLGDQAFDAQDMIDQLELLQ